VRFKPILVFIYTTIVIVIVVSLTMTALQDSLVNQDAVLKFLFWETRKLPVLYFVVLAFIVGLFLGLLVALFDNFHNRKIIKELKKTPNNQPS
jgi:uncharacterized integral membrane protein